MGETVRFLAFLLGLVIVGWAVVSVFATLVMPRAASTRLLRVVSRAVVLAVRPLLRWAGGYVAKDRISAVIGPLGMVLLFVVWLLLLAFGFGLVAWWTSGSTFAHSLAIAGSSTTTLGVATGPHLQTEVVEFVAAGTGLLVVALEIAYLPTLYAAFSSREAEVTLLATRAGTPAWGPEILARFHWFRTMDELPDFYRAWERWSAEVAESHTNYPSLMWFRSPVPTRSWLTALTAVLDASALHDAVCPGAAPRQARLCLQMGMNCLRAVAETLHIDYEHDPLPSTPTRLTYDEFRVGYARLEAVGFPMERALAEAWPHFAGWRVNYETIVDQLTRATMPPPAPWFLDRPELGAAPLPRVLDRTPDDPMAEHNPE